MKFIKSGERFYVISKREREIKNQAEVCVLFSFLSVIRVDALML